MTELDSLALRVQLPGFPGTSYDGEVLALFEEGLGGACLFGSNTASGARSVQGLAASVSDVAPGALLAIDEEGGDVTRLHTDAGSPVLGAAGLGVVDDLDLTRATGRAVGDDLVALGIRLDLAPVADVNSNPDNPVIGTRSFGADPDRVAAHVAAWVAGLQEAGVSACVKHFPGHGDTGEDSHVALPTLEADPGLLRRRELPPFVAAVAAGADAVMTSHLLVRALDPALPATLSPTVLGLLRSELGFDGAVVTDALDMAGASAGRGIPEAAVLALAAGADLLCPGAEKDVALVRDVQRAVVDAVRGGRLGEDRLVDAADRVSRLGTRGSHGTATGLAPLTAAARRALTVEGTVPRLVDAQVVRLAGPANIAMGDAGWGLRPDLELAPDQAVPECTGPLVVEVRDAHRQPAVSAFLARIPEDRPVLVVEWGWPGPAPGRPRLCTHGTSRPMVAAVTEVLEAAGWHR